MMSYKDNRYRDTYTHTCRYYDNGVCLLSSDSEVTEYCVEGPCSDEVMDEVEE